MRTIDPYAVLKESSQTCEDQPTIFQSLGKFGPHSGFLYLQVAARLVMGFWPNQLLSQCGKRFCQEHASKIMD